MKTAFPRKACVKPTLAACGLCLLVPALALAAPALYRLVDLGPDVQVRGISPQGLPFGDHHTVGAFLSAGGPSDIGTLPEGTFSEILGAQDGCGTVGMSSTGHLGLETHAFHRVRGVLRDLGTLETPEQFSAATGLNCQQIVGYGDRAGTDAQPIVWNRAGGPAQALPTLGGPSGYADAISPTGVIVGQLETPAGEFHAALWLFGQAYDLTPDGGAWSRANAVSRQGTVVGELHRHAWRWRPTTGGEDLGTLPGDVWARLLAVNNAGIAVGSSLSPGDIHHEFVEIERAIRVVGTTLVDLNQLVVAPGWALHEAVGISEAGVIAGNGTLNGVGHGWLLVPVR